MEELAIGYMNEFKIYHNSNFHKAFVKCKFGKETMTEKRVKSYRFRICKCKK